MVTAGWAHQRAQISRGPRAGGHSHVIVSAVHHIFTRSAFVESLGIESHVTVNVLHHIFTLSAYVESWGLEGHVAAGGILTLPRVRLAAKRTRSTGREERERREEDVSEDLDHSGLVWCWIGPGPYLGLLFRRLFAALGGAAQQSRLPYRPCCLHEA